MAITNISVFRSTDGGMTQAGATTGRMSGTAGDRIGLLNSILLTGYNWQELTPANLTQVGNVATVNQATHGFNIDQRLWIVGMDQQGYLNGLTYGDAVYLTSVADTSHFTFPVTGSPTSPATAAGSTTLGVAIGSMSATSITLTSGASFPNFPYVIKIDSEYMLVTAGFQTTTPTVRRGMFGSTAATHLISAATTQKIMMGVAPAGGAIPWTADFTATNKSTYRAPAGSRMYLDADDTGTTGAAVRGYETMSAVGTGTGPFPTVAQIATANYFASSGTASTAARPWLATATDRWVLIITDTLNLVVNCNTQGCLNFGDLIDQQKSGDAYPCRLSASASITGNGVDSGLAIGGTTTLNNYMPRSYTQVGSSINVGNVSIDGRTSQSYSGSAGGMTYPHPPDGGLYVSKIAILEGSYGVNRGTVPGLWWVMHSRPGQNNDIFYGTGAFSGKKFQAVMLYSAAEIFVEISNTVQAT